MPDKEALTSMVRRFAFAAIVIAATMFPQADGLAQQSGAPPETPATPGGGHFSAPDPANLTPDEAIEIYRGIRDRMVAGYRLSGNGAARNFIRWQRFNSAPYRSATHGRRYVNNYANAPAESYGLYERAGTMPSGAIVAKDTFYVSESGSVFPGALMVMEKMPAGFDDATGDWRYTMIMPDGSLFGTTGGENAESVKFCATCHVLAAANDHLFFMPEAFRIASE